MKHHEYMSDMDTDKIELPDKTILSRDYTWHIRDLKQYILQRISGLTIDEKRDKVLLSRIYETLTGETVKRDKEKGEDFVVITKNQL